MENKVIRKYLVDGYNSVTFTHNYIWGWMDTKTKMVYGFKTMNSANLLPWITKLDVASEKNGGSIQLKFSPDREQKRIITDNAVEIKPICTIEHFEEIRANATGIEKNKGYIFERLACEVFNLKQNTKPNAKATECGDGIDTNGIHFQIKFAKATMIDEKTLKNFKEKA